MVFGAKMLKTKREKHRKHYTAMLETAKKVWNRLSYLGIDPQSTHPDKENIILGNQVVYILCGVLLLLIAGSAYFGIWVAVKSLSLMVLFFIGLSYLIYKGFYRSGRILGIVLQNINLTVQAILLGYDSRVIDFLIITSLMPLVLFDIRERKTIFLCIFQNFLFYILYHILRETFEPFGLPHDQQILIYNLTIPLKFITILTVVYVIIRKTASQQEKQEKRSLELLAQRNYFTNILNALPVDIATLDTELHYTFLNKHSIQDETLRQWMIGKTDYDYIQARNADITIARQREKMFRQALTSGEVTTIEEFSTDRQGRKRVIIRGVAPLIDPVTQKVSGLVGYGLDITDRKQAEEKLTEAYHELENVNAGLKQFAYVTSHDLKTPLRNISTYLQLLRRRNQLDDESNEMVENVVKSVKHLNQLITDIFLYTTTDFKNDGGEQTELSEVVKKVTEDIQALLQEKHTELIVPENLPQLKIDRTQAIHVFSNLISNALKYNQSEHPRVEIFYKSENGWAHFTVRDNGIGIAEQYQEQIFEIFKRLHTQEEYEGTGIGLAICKKIIESYGGYIKVSSKPGYGSEFIFTLPVA